MPTPNENVFPFRSRKAFMRAQEGHLVAILDEVRGDQMRRAMVTEEEAPEIMYADTGLPFLWVPVAQLTSVSVIPMCAYVGASPLSKPGRFAVHWNDNGSERVLAEDIAAGEVVTALRAAL